MAASIKIDQTRPGGSPSTGTAGFARNDLWNNLAIGLTSSGGGASPNWSLVFSPSGSTTTLSSPTGTSVSFTPDKTGTYRIQLTVDDGIGANKQVRVARVRFDSTGNIVDFGLVLPAPGELDGESNYLGNARGWDEPIMQWLAFTLRLTGSLSINDNIVATVSGTNFRGPVRVAGPTDFTRPNNTLDVSGSASVTGSLVVINGFISSALGFSGSLTKLGDGRSYIVGAGGVTITSSSNGQIIVSSSTGQLTNLPLGPSGTVIWSDGVTNQWSNQPVIAKTLTIQTGAFKTFFNDFGGSGSAMYMGNVVPDFFNFVLVEYVVGSSSVLQVGVPGINGIIGIGPGGNSTIYVKSSSVQFVNTLTTASLEMERQTIDNPTHDLVIRGQQPFAGANTNKSPGNLILDIPAASNGGTIQGFTKFSWGSSIKAQFGATTIGSSVGLLYLGTTTPIIPAGSGVGNYALQGDGATVLGLNGPSVSSSLQFSIANNVRWTITDGRMQATSLQAAEIAHNGITTDSATTNFTIRSQAPLATAVNNIGAGSLILSAAGGIGPTGSNGFIVMGVSGSEIVRVGITGTLGTVGITGSLTVFTGISGSLTNLYDGRSYLVGIGSVTITSSSNGQIVISGSGGGGGGAPVGAQYVTLASDATLTSERILTAGTGVLLTDSGANSTVTLAINNNVVATVSGTKFTGVVSASAGLSGSLQQVGPGLSYLLSQGTITITTQSNGQVIISGSGGSASSVTMAGDVISASSANVIQRITGVTGSVEMRATRLTWVNTVTAVTMSIADATDINTKGGDINIDGGNATAIGNADGGSVNIFSGRRGDNGNNDGTVKLGVIGFTDIECFGGTVQVGGGLISLLSSPTQFLCGGTTQFYMAGTSQRLKGPTRIASDVGLPNNTLDVSGSASLTGSLLVIQGSITVSGSANGFSGSLTRLHNGVSYIVGGSGVNVSSASNGQVTITATGLPDVSASYVTIGNTGSLPNERALTAGTGITMTDGGAGSTITLAINDNVVATISGTNFRGAVRIAGGDFLIPNNTLDVSGSGLSVTGSIWVRQGQLTVSGASNLSGNVSVTGSLTSFSYVDAGAGDGGRVRIGANGVGFATLWLTNNTPGGTNYSLMGDSVNNYLNAPSGKTLFRVGNIDVGNWGSTGLRISSDQGAAGAALDVSGTNGSSIASVVTGTFQVTNATGAAVVQLSRYIAGGGVQPAIYLLTAGDPPGASNYNLLNNGGQMLVNGTSTVQLLIGNGGKFSVNSTTAATQAGIILSSAGPFSASVGAFITGSQLVTADGRRQHITAITGNYQILQSDELIVINSIAGSSITASLPTNPTSGDKYQIKDVFGNLSASMTLCLSSSNKNIENGDGPNNTRTKTFTLAYSSLDISYTGTQWSIIDSNHGDRRLVAGQDIGINSSSTGQIIISSSMQRATIISNTFTGSLSGTYQKALLAIFDSTLSTTHDLKVGDIVEITLSGMGISEFAVNSFFNVDLFKSENGGAQTQITLGNNALTGTCYMNAQFGSDPTNQYAGTSLALTCVTQVQTAGPWRLYLGTRVQGTASFVRVYINAGLVKVYGST